MVFSFFGANGLEFGRTLREKMPCDICGLMCRISHSSFVAIAKVDLIMDERVSVVVNRVALVVVVVDSKTIYQGIQAGDCLVDCIVLVIGGIESEEIQHQGKSPIRWHVGVAF